MRDMRLVLCLCALLMFSNENILKYCFLTLRTFVHIIQNIDYNDQQEPRRIMLYCVLLQFTSLYFVPVVHQLLRAGFACFVIPFSSSAVHTHVIVSCFGSVLFY